MDVSESADPNLPHSNIPMICMNSYLIAVLCKRAKASGIDPRLPVFTRIKLAARLFMYYRQSSVPESHSVCFHTYCRVSQLAFPISILSTVDNPRLNADGVPHC